MKKKLILVLGIAILAIMSTFSLKAILPTDTISSSSVVCKCRPFWHNSCLSRSGGNPCAGGDNCRVGDGNCNKNLPGLPTE